MLCFFFKQKTAYEMRMSDWSSDVCSSDLKHVEFFRAPGAYEIPLAAKLLLDGRFDGVVALGAVIRGDTPHFDYVAGECARGLIDVQLQSGKPIGFGVLTVNTVEQAVEQIGRASCRERVCQYV